MSVAFFDASICISLLSVVAGSFRALSSMQKFLQGVPKFTAAWCEGSSSFTATVIQFGIIYLLLIPRCINGSVDSTILHKYQIASLQVAESPRRCIDSDPGYEHHLRTQRTAVSQCLSTTLPRKLCWQLQSGRVWLPACWSVI